MNKIQEGSVVSKWVKTFWVRLGRLDYVHFILMIYQCSFLADVRKFNSLKYCKRRSNSKLEYKKNLKRTMRIRASRIFPGSLVIIQNLPCFSLAVLKQLDWSNWREKRLISPRSSRGTQTITVMTTCQQPAKACTRAAGCMVVLHLQPGSRE